MLEADLALTDGDRTSTGLVLDTELLLFERHQFFHVVDRALQVADVHAHFAQVALQHEEHRQRERDVAYARFAARPQEQRRAKDRGLDQHQHAALHAAIERTAHPRAFRAMTPLADDAGEQHFFAHFGTKRLDDRVAAHGISQRAAHLRVPGIGETRSGRDEAERQHRRDRDVDQRADAHDRTHQRPAHAEQHGGAHQHHERRKQRDQQRVVEDVERPHAARDLAHSRAGEAVGMPVGRKALHPLKRIGGDLAHHLERQRDDVHEDALT